MPSKMSDEEEQHTAKFYSDADAMQYIRDFEEKNGVRYVWRKSKFSGKTNVKCLDQKILFESKGRGSVPIAYDGVPFIVISSDMLECQYGPLREKKKEVLDSHIDHHYTWGTRSRRHIQPTKKMNCTAKIKLRRIVKFPEFTIEGLGSKWRKLAAVKKLKQQFTDITCQEYCVFVQISGEHNDHVTGKFSSYSNRLDQRVIKHIKRLTKDGITNVSEVQRRTIQFSETISPPDPDRNDKTLFPQRKDVYNHIYKTLADTSSPNRDQLQIAKCIDEWREKAQEGDRIFFRPMSETEQLLFVYQTTFQRHLLKKYGQEICLLDSTYKTTKYTLPLSFVVTHTNVGYQVVAAFVVGKETTKGIAEALTKIAQWNQNWRPENWVTDYDQREITALEQVFPETCVLLCDFHREQSWQRWLRAKKNGVSHEKDLILKQLRIIAHSKDEETFKAEVTNLRKLDVYTRQKTFRNWIDKLWLLECKRWVYCFRKHILDISVNTTNGVERQHKLLKEKYLKENGFGGTLTSLLTVLVRKFFPDMQEKYRKSNAQALRRSKSYSPHMPEFLKEKPRTFIEHCLKRMPPKVETIDLQQVVKNQTSENLTFLVCNYTVSYEHQVPFCSCQDFAKHHWPCKHILAIFNHFPEHGWNSLNKLYTNQPIFNLDLEVIQDKDIGNSSMEINSENILESYHPVSMDEELEELNPVEMRKKCVEVLKNVQNNLYGTDNVLVLSKVNESLIEIDEYLDQETVKIAGLPTRIRGKNKRKLNFKHKYMEKKPRRVTENIVPMDCDISSTDLENNLLVTNETETMDDNISPALAPFLKDIDQLWKSPPNMHYQIGKIGPYVLTAESFKFLQTTLSDEVIDSYLHLLCRSTNGRHINCVVMTSIFNGSDEIHSLLRQENILEYQFCIGAVNEGGNHWILMIILPHERKILYLNPLGEREINQQQLLLHWYTFLHARYSVRLEEKIAEEWEILTPDHAKQFDGISCGVYVLELAERFVNGESLQFTWSNDEIVNVRKAIGARLLYAADNILKDRASNEGENVAIFIEDKSGQEVENLDLPVFHYQPSPEVVQSITMEDNQSDQEVEPTYNHEVTQDVYQNKKETSTLIQRSRRNIKHKRRESFDYRIKRRNRYCICRKASRGVYWCCDKCNSWYHPSCIGRDDQEELPKEETTFYCNECLATIVADWSVMTPVMMEEDADDQTYFVTQEDVKKWMPIAYQRCFNIIHAEGTKSNVPWLQRHYNFVKGNQQKLNCFGEGVFNISACAMIQINLEHQFLKMKNEKAVYSRHFIIDEIANEYLMREFQQESGLADHYLKTVLRKEAMIAIFQDMTSSDYETASKELKKTEAKGMIEGLKLVYDYRHKTTKEY